MKLILTIIYCAYYFLDPRFQEITELSGKVFKESKDICLQVPRQSKTHLIYLKRLQDIQGQQPI